jgi:hypothetical protein
MCVCVCVSKCVALPAIWSGNFAPQSFGRQPRASELVCAYMCTCIVSLSMCACVHVYVCVHVCACVCLCVTIIGMGGGGKKRWRPEIQSVLIVIFQS